jgi:hypothetical protein
MWIDAAKAAIRYERPALAPVEKAPDGDFVPLAERLKVYEARDDIEESRWSRNPASIDARCAGSW